ncbi:sigma-70 family RNA polymerase sigma factor [Trichococcus ilyis]|jgi:RNA polymerase sigma factor (sigma-70 family)|uniref:RNA polymerase sigma factor, sigma-70 family n=1 Tax=Trichococcus ilyis TaxID=640938 RepID=A0A143YQG8_9LACT|nr:sigma-70 family RNA polymerase sigma factor [Trichococcus ilyis]CZQ94534.1 transcription regulator luxr c-terminal [Trichococcus ilyis]SEJ02476.1 RNA polymerase sigma factor, sigma-70 family [Trichococcus ilyis]
MNIKKRSCNDETATQLSELYAGIIHHCLNKINRYPDHNDYDDFYQLGLITLFDTYETCRKDALAAENSFLFVSYAKQKIHWTFLDQIRKDRKKESREAYLSEEELEEIPHNSSFEEQLEQTDLLQRLCAGLTAEENAYLRDALAGLSITEIARKQQLSRKTIYKRRKQIQAKAGTFLKD